MGRMSIFATSTGTTCQLQGLGLTSQTQQPDIALPCYVGVGQTKYITTTKLISALLSSEPLSPALLAS